MRFVSLNAVFDLYYRHGDRDHGEDEYAEKQYYFLAVIGFHFVIAPE